MASNADWWQWKETAYRSNTLYKGKRCYCWYAKLIDGVNSQKIDLDSTESNIKAASVYNTAIDDSLYEIKNAVYLIIKHSLFGIKHAKKFIKNDIKTIYVQNKD